MRRRDTRILTPHVGSLIRPAELLERSKASRASAEAQGRYDQALRRATIDVVAQQLDAGIDIVNDGEYGKSSWANYVLDRMTGVRHEHECRVWQTTKLPQGRMLIPGVVTHHPTTVEHPRLVADRIVQFAKLVGRENVIAGTECLRAARNYSTPF